jgi:hypothetical protein
MVYIIAIRLSSSGRSHEHITDVQWQQGTNIGQMTKQEMVDWINQGGEARVRDSITGREALVGVVNDNPPYLRTYADGYYNDNLLSLPTF